MWCAGTLVIRSSAMRTAAWRLSGRCCGAARYARTFSRLAEPSESSVEVRGWVEGVTPIEPLAVEQLQRIAKMKDIVRRPVVAMPDIHLGNGVAVGIVLPTLRAIIPSAVGVDIGCGMIAVKTSLTAADLPPNLEEVRLAIELAVPHGRTHAGRPENDAGSWRSQIPQTVADAWRRVNSSVFDKGSLEERFKRLCVKYPKMEQSNHINHLGTLGTGNHFIEVCLDESNALWVMVHSGSRGVGGHIGSTFIELAKRDMGNLLGTIPSAELAYVREGTSLFDDYVTALRWAQDFARVNREVMLANILQALRTTPGMPPFTTDAVAINCHHNYVEEFGALPDGNGHEWLTRKGATSAKKGEMGIIPGSMGAKSFIVRGKGHPDAYESCSHGAGRAMSRGEAVRRFTVEDHQKATEGVCCRKDKDVIDETPAAYKNIDAVIAAQSDLIEVVHVLRQIVCVKG